MYAIAALNYIALTLLLLAAAASLAVGLHRVRARIASGAQALPTRINGAALLRRGLLLSRLLKRPASGLAHLLLFFGALIEIAGHGLYSLTFVGVPVYQGWFGFLFMELGRELAGIMMLAGAALSLIHI